MRRGAKPAKTKSEARLPVARKSLKSDGSRVRDLEKRLAEALKREAEALKREAEALEQQTATAEILSVISSSPTDIQPVFAAVLRSAARLCDAFDAGIFQVEGDGLRLVAREGPIPSSPVGAFFLIRGTAAGRAVLDRRTIHVPDLQAEVDEFPESSAFARSYGYRTTLTVPLLHGAEAIGAIGIRRTEVRPFTDRQIELLQTFADQAVIAIENVRLFNETKESLEQQTATSEVLRVISSSPTDVQPVFDTIARKALDLCLAKTSTVFRFDGELVHLVAGHSLSPEGIESLRRVFPIPPGRGAAATRAILGRAIVYIPDIREDPDFRLQAVVQAIAYRSVLAVPMLHESTPIGAISVAGAKPAAFSQRQIDLLKTFADQAVIAIENVRLFNETKEALEQQTATAEILRVIASSPTDLQPVMEAVAENAARVCGATDSSIFRLEGEHLRNVARRGSLRRPTLVGDTIPASRDTVGGRAVRDRQTIYVEDIMAAEAEFPVTVSLRRETAPAYRTIVGTPLLREDTPLGVIMIARGPEVQPFSARQIALLETFANQAVIAIENVRLFKELEARNRDLTETLEQQTATGEILRVISSSPTDLQPVMEAIAENAARVCGAMDSGVFLLEGEQGSGVLRAVARRGSLVRASLMGEPVPVTRDTVGGQVVIGRRTIHVEDILAAEAEFPITVSRLNRGGSTIRTMLATPLLREDTPLGVIFVNRGPEPNPFSAKQIALLETFANQAVIAIENVRLFKELEDRNRDLTETLEQQTATGQILRVISSSPMDTQPVFEMIAESAARLCEAHDALVRRVHAGYLELAANYGSIPTMLQQPIHRAFPSGRAVLDRETVQVLDLAADLGSLPEELGENRAAALKLGIRTVLAVPLVREGASIGVIVIRRRVVRAFTENQIALVKTFADQAVIAIENVRLFTELQQKNRALTEAHAQVTESLEQQTATADVLKLISRSTFDIQPVLETLIESAVRLCGAEHGHVYRFDGELLQRAAGYGSSPEHVELRRRHPIRLWRGSLTGRAALERRVVHVPDVLADPEFGELEAQRLLGLRTGLCVPLLKEDELIGVLALWRTEVRPFTDTQIGLVTTFADQAVIAIENVRLLQELQARTRELGRSVEELKALGEVGRAVSSTLDLQTVLTTIVSRAVELSGTSGGVIYEHDEATGELRLRASHQVETELVELLRGAPVRLSEGVTGRAAALMAPVQVVDLLLEREFAVAHISPIAEGLGYRSILAVPLLLEDRVMGGLTVWRKQPGGFTAEVVHLLQTFAAQSSLAIQNARLFREIADKSRQLEAASRHKSEFLANMSHELRTPLNAILGFSEVLAERMFGEVNEKQAEYLQDILSSGRHLLSLINDILDLSKVEAGRLELELGRFHLPTALDNALTLVRERATRHGITLTHTVDPRLGDIVADERKVKQILLNLLSNAVKFTPEGGRVRVTAALVEDVITIEVSDTGIGIAPEDQAAIFEEFRQVGRDDARKQEGTGLGLTLAKKFVELHGGRIWVRSQVGLGSTFSFTLSARPGERGARDQGGGEPPRP